MTTDCLSVKKSDVLGNAIAFMPTAAPSAPRTACDKAAISSRLQSCCRAYPALIVSHELSLQISLKRLLDS